jgi:hypothetical protein
MIFGAAKTFFATHRELPVKVFWSVGFEENPPQGVRIVDDLKEFAALMNDAYLSGYESELMVFDNESHHSVSRQLSVLGTTVCSMQLAGTSSM